MSCRPRTGPLHSTCSSSAWIVSSPRRGPRASIFRAARAPPRAPSASGTVHRPAPTPARGARATGFWHRARADGSRTRSADAPAAPSGASIQRMSARVTKCQVGRMTCVRRISPALNAASTVGVVEAVRRRPMAHLAPMQVLRLHRAQLRHDRARACGRPDPATGCGAWPQYAACRGAHQLAHCAAERASALEAEPRAEPGAHRCARRENSVLRA